jgi:hypothetical protein
LWEKQNTFLDERKDTKFSLDIVWVKIIYSFIVGVTENIKPEPLNIKEGNIL